ncbi:MAG: hypothetical protein AAB654_18790, partial [Acidobacteriota bacterium]
ISTGISNAAFEWMPDSRQVLLDRFLLDLETGVKSSLPFTDNLNGQTVRSVAPGKDSNTFIVILVNNPSKRFKLVEYKLDSGATRDLYEAPADYNLNYSAISPDGRSLIVSERERTEPYTKALVVIPVEGGKGHDLIRVKGDYLGPAHWTADSKSVLVAGGFLGGKAAFWWFPVAPGEKPRKLLDFDIVGTQMSLHPDGRTLAFHSGWPKAELWTATNVLPPR